MKVIAAYLLAQLGGNSSPSANALKKILNSVGAEIDHVKIELLLSQVDGKDINELIAAGKERLASSSMSFGCVGGGTNNNASVDGKVDVVEEKKEEKKVDKVEESDEEDYSFSLFD